MVDTFVENDMDKCIGCEKCTVVCPEQSIYINEFDTGKKIKYSAHFKKETQNCNYCIHKNKQPPCIKVCPEQAIEIISR